VPRPADGFRWTDRRDTHSSSFFLNVDGDDDTIEMTVYLDTRCLSPGDTEAVLRTMADVALRSV
jgi:hypothetical protein